MDNGLFAASLKKLALPAVVLAEDWQYLIHAFSTHDVKFGFSLQSIQTVFSLLECWQSHIIFPTFKKK